MITGSVKSSKIISSLVEVQPLSGFVTVSEYVPAEMVGSGMSEELAVLRGPAEVCFIVVR